MGWYRQEENGEDSSGVFLMSWSVKGEGDSSIMFLMSLDDEEEWVIQGTGSMECILVSL